MGGCNPMMETLEEENLIAAARLLLRALDSNKKITDKARKVLADVSARLTSVMKIAAPKDEDEDEDEQEGGEVTDIRERINLILEKIVTWEGGDSMIWDCDPEDGKEYLKTVDEARRLAESLESLNLSKDETELLRNLTDYGDSLNACLKDHEQAVDDQDSSSSPDTSPGNNNDDTNNGNSSSSPMALHFRLLMSILEHNLEEKSKLYKDEALRHLFMMNNINYMAEKVKNSELRNILGDNWIRKHNWKFQQHAMSYERATWSSILNLLRQDGLSGSGSSGSSTSRTLLRERLHAFYTAFEDIYKSQTGWSIPNSQLREDVRISMSLKVIQAYRNFVGRHNNNISEKYIKYSADDLENYIMDLFEGAPKSLHSFHRK
ncbi:putative exocyst complex component Exo70, cullin repeat-like-containing domain superfamily [Helianthus annuus]|nr:putative exocyst complex component Exo70, cullin repeat-like-containing domain superfamily [Helianthus annuus]